MGLRRRYQTAASPEGVPPHGRTDKIEVFKDSILQAGSVPVVAALDGTTQQSDFEWRCTALSGQGA